MSKILSLEDLKKKLDLLRQKKKKIVLCHGVFDLVHPGHINHFKSAKKFGDILVVSITADHFINKGHNRPLFNSENRRKILSEMTVIDFVCESQSSDAVSIIEKLKPDIYCKGPDFKNKKKDLTKKIQKEIKAIKKVGGKFKTTSDQTFSSSKIINTINKDLTIQDKFLSKVNKKFTKDKIYKILDSFDKLKILVLGESIIDEYVFCETLGKSGKEPVLTMKPYDTKRFLGGSLAVCNHLSTFCKKVSLISYLGEKNEEHNFIKKNLSKNISTHFINKVNSPTIIKKRFIEGVNKIKVLGIYSINDDLVNNRNEVKLYNLIKKKIKEHDLIIICDYGHGLINKKISNLIINSKKPYTLNAQINSSNTGHHTLDKFSKMLGIVINANELRHEFRDNSSSIAELAKKLQKKAKTQNILVTSGSDGASLIYRNEVHNAPAFAKQVVDKIGAGDSMLALVSLCIKKDIDKDLTLYLGSLASAHTVENVSNSSPIDKNYIKKIISHQLLN